MNNVERIIEMAQKAIEESGKNFDSIDKQTMLSYLDSKGVSNPNMRESIYARLKEMNSTVTKMIDTRAITQASQKAENVTESVKKQPRKSVFGEIKRIA